MLPPIAWGTAVDAVFGLLFIAVAAMYYWFALGNVRVPIWLIITIGFGVFIVLNIVHQCGQAVVATLMGREVAAISFGYGPVRLMCRGVGGTLVDVRAILLSGHTHIVADIQRFREALPALVMFGVEVSLLTAMWTWDAPQGNASVIRAALVCSLLYGLLINFWPRRMDMPPLGQIGNDGRLLLDLARDVPVPPWSLVSTASDIQFALLERPGTPETIVENAAGMFERAPERELVRLQYGARLAAFGYWREAIEVLSPLEEWNEPDDWFQAAILCDLAWSALMTFDPLLISDALRWSERAELIQPVLPAASGCRGAALVIAGDPDQGMPLLLRAYRTHRGDPVRRSVICGFAALGAAAQGQRALARDRYAAMVAYDADCSIRSEVQARLAKPEFGVFAGLVGDVGPVADTMVQSEGESHVISW